MAQLILGDIHPAFVAGGIILLLVVFGMMTKKGSLPSTPVTSQLDESTEKSLQMLGEAHGGALKSEAVRLAKNGKERQQVIGDYSLLILNQEDCYGPRDIRRLPHPKRTIQAAMLIGPILSADDKWAENCLGTFLSTSDFQPGVDEDLGTKLASFLDKFNRDNADKESAIAFATGVGQVLESDAYKSCQVELAELTVLIDVARRARAAAKAAHY